MRHVYFTVSVGTSSIDPDEWYASEEAARAVAQDSWREGFSVLVHRHTVSPKTTIIEMEHRINERGVWE